jgi:uncharacterized protein with HEPN domain
MTLDRVGKLFNLPVSKLIFPYNQATSIQKIKKYTEGMNFELFIQDDKTIDACVRNFEIIGEVSSKIEEDFKLTHPEIEWKRMKGLRNRMIHDYSGIDYQVVWDIISEYLDELEYQVQQLLK